ncbi:MAG: UDP-3-O-[3-hydroxymyristoyl] N-acetylglucosamine deacetylase [Rickettsiaceae bacterium]|nr:UDP-3-O-[3-hydroxymyristoyl] N-acetylglucosamine deacetylase [Rickettsiaceae bacterium]
MQKTISEIIRCSGHGVHSNKTTTLTFKPAPADNGIIFVRTDLSEDNKIKAHYLNVCDTKLSTTIQNTHNVKVSTIEHLMAALWGNNIDNIIIEIDNEEVPIMDGSSQSFVEIIQQVGIQKQESPKKTLKLLREIQVTEGECKIIAKPSEQLRLEVDIDFAHVAIGKQNHSCTGQEIFLQEIANARTFGFLKDLEMLQKMGLAKGASLENTIGIDDKRIMNPEGVRYNNEFARHKLLDLIGDLFTCGGNFIFDLHGYKTSHHLNNTFLRKLFDSTDNYQWITS